MGHCIIGFVHGFFFTFGMAAAGWILYNYVIKGMVDKARTEIKAAMRESGGSNGS